MSRKQAMEYFLELFEPEWYLEAYDIWPDHVISEDGELIEKENDVERQEEFSEERLNTAENKKEFSEERLNTAENKKDVKMIDKKLYNDVKRIFSDGCKSFVWFPLDDGWHDAHVEYSRNILISDSAAFLWNQYYDL